MISGPINYFLVPGNVAVQFLLLSSGWPLQVYRWDWHLGAPLLRLSWAPRLREVDRVRGPQRLHHRPPHRAVSRGGPGQALRGLQLASAHGAGPQQHLDAIRKAIPAAKARTVKLMLIGVKAIIGYDTPN